MEVSMRRRHIAIILIVIGLVLVVPGLEDIFINLPLAMAASAITGVSVLLTYPATYIVGGVALCLGLYLRQTRSRRA